MALEMQAYASQAAVEAHTVVHLRHFTTLDGGAHDRVAASLIDTHLAAIHGPEQALACCSNIGGIKALAARVAAARTAFHDQLRDLARHHLRSAFNHGLGLLARRHDNRATAILKFMLDEIHAEVQRRSGARHGHLHLPHLALEHDRA